MTMKSKLIYLKFVFTDEFYMIIKRDLYHMDLILRKTPMKQYLPFGGVCVIMVGEPDQMPPVPGYSRLGSVFFPMPTHKANDCGELLIRF